MDSNALAIVLGTGLVSFLLGSFLRRLWLKRRQKRARELLQTLQAAVRERAANEPPALNKAKRRRQQRERAGRGKV